MRVVAPGVDAGLAICEDDAGDRAEVMTGVVGPVGVGDTLLVHAGTALLRLEAAA
jgi:hydrogenase maturation factor